MGRIHYINDYMYDFLLGDDVIRGTHEEWYLDKGDGSIYWSSPSAITMGMTKLLKELGFHEEGQSIHWFRRARNMDIVETNPNHGKNQLRHSNMATNETFYQTNKKPDDLLETLNESNRKRHSVN